MKIITTARGVALNLEELMLKSKRPANFKEEKAEFTPAPKPKVEQALNLRGFMPAQSTMPLPENPHLTEDKPAVAGPVAEPAQALKGSEKSIADFTQITIDQAPSIEAKGTPKPGDGAKLASKILEAKQTGAQTVHGKGAGKSTVLDDLDEKSEGIET
jgi:hypothetical protein